MIGGNKRQLTAGRLNGMDLKEVWLNKVKIWPEDSPPAPDYRREGLMIKSDTVNFLATVVGAENEFPEKLYVAGTEYNIGPVLNQGSDYTYKLHLTFDVKNSQDAKVHVRLTETDLLADFWAPSPGPPFPGSALWTGGDSDNVTITNSDPDRPGQGELDGDIYKDFSWLFTLIPSIGSVDYTMYGRTKDDWGQSTTSNLKYLTVEFIDNQTAPPVTVTNGADGMPAVPSLIIEDADYGDGNEFTSVPIPVANNMTYLELTMSMVLPSVSGDCGFKLSNIIEIVSPFSENGIVDYDTKEEVGTYDGAISEEWSPEWNCLIIHVHGSQFTKVPDGADVYVYTAKYKARQGLHVYDLTVEMACLGSE